MLFLPLHFLFGMGEWRSMAAPAEIKPLRRLNRMCSSTLSVNCEYVEKDTQE